MKYIIDEIELKNLIKSLLDIPDENDIEDIKKDFLSDKKPVEMIASGKYDAIQLYWLYWHTDTNPIIQKCSNVDYKGKSIKIYIGE